MSKLRRRQAMKTDLKWRKEKKEGRVKMERERQRGQFACCAAVILPRQLGNLLQLYLATKDSKNLKRTYTHTHTLLGRVVICSRPLIKTAWSAVFLHSHTHTVAGC